MNFGKWIVVSFVLFALFIGVLVTVCVREDVSLVSRNYYQDELDYQHQIERLNNAEQLATKPVIMVNDRTLQVKFDQFPRVDQGQLKLFRPSDVRFDKTFDLRASEAGDQEFDVSQLPVGLYKARLQWSMMGKEYYVEQIITI